MRGYFNSGLSFQKSTAALSISITLHQQKPFTYFTEKIQAMGKLNKEDAVEYEILYKSFFRRLYNYGKKFTNDVTMIEDSIQELFMDVWNRTNLTTINSPDSYYFATFRYILFRKLKDASRIVQLSHGPEDPEFCIEQQLMNIETTEEVSKRLRSALENLTSRQREAIFLRFYEGLSYEEIGQVLDISVKATYKLMARSLLSLKEKFTLALRIVLILSVCC